MEQQTFAVDVHAHYGTAIDQDDALTNELLSGDAETVVVRAEMAGIKYSLVSPLAALYTSDLDVILSSNLHANEMATRHKGLLHWAVVNPLLPDTYAQARELLQTPRCIGIKIHPEQHHYKISNEGKAIFAFAAEADAVIETHSGQANSEPMDYVQFSNAFPEVKLILSHLGYHWDNDLTQQVRAIQSIRHQNVYTDTSSYRSIYPNMLEWAVKEIGASRILFGTDSPLYYSPMQRARVDYAQIGEAEKQLILRDNALRLFPGLRKG